MYHTCLDAFILLVKQGRTSLEAEREFDKEKIHAALREELDLVGNGPLLDFLAQARMEECDESAMVQAVELWMNGWTSESVSKHSRVMSWYWRSPPKGKRPLGRQYLSTNQAWNALQKIFKQ